MQRIVLFLRSLLFVLLIMAAAVVWFPVCFLFAPFPYRYRYFCTSRWNMFAILCAKIVCGIDYQFKGFENLPNGPAVLLSKHQSAWESIFYLYGMPRPIVFVYKKELAYIPFFGWGLALLRMIPIDRRKEMNAFKQIIKLGKKSLNDGQWILMFPEGTRGEVGESGQYKGSGTWLATKTNTPVVPIAMNSGECWPKNSFIKKPGMITVSIGQPISPEGLTHIQLMQRVENWIESEMRVISPEVYSKK